MITVGLVGYGYWGPNLLRNFYECPETEIIALCDHDANALKRASARYPSVSVSTSLSDLLSNPQIDAIAIATPVSTHYDIAKKVLESGRHVFVEKPMCSDAEQGKKLLELAAAKNLLIHVDHTFVYTPAVRKIYELMQEGTLGEIYYYDSVRVNLGLFQKDVNVLWDLAVHDLSIMDYLLPEKPVAVSATGAAHIAGYPENTAYLTLYFESNMVAHVHVNWLAPVKIRQTLLGGSKNMVVYNDLEPSEKIKVYDSGVNTETDPEKLREVLTGYRTGDVWSPKIPLTEALQEEVRHFAHCIRLNCPSDTDGYAGLDVLRVLTAAEISMQNQGRSVCVKTGKCI